MKVWSWRRVTLTLAACVLCTACSKRSADESLSAAKGYLAQRDGPAAIIELKNALQLEPDSPEARFLLGKTLLERGEAATASVELRKAADLNVPPDQVVPLLAKALLRSGEFRKVVELETTTVLDSPEAVASLKTSAALAQSALGSNDRALTLVTQALRADPDHVPALLFRSRSLAAKGQFEEAIKIVDDVLARTPGDADALTLKGDLLLAAHKDKQGAAESYRRAIASQPDHLAAHTALLNQLLDDNDIDGARAQLDALKGVHPARFQTSYFEARLQAQSGDLKSAYESTQRLLKAAPKDPRALQLAAALELRRGEPALAQARLGSLLQIQPDSDNVRQMLARSLLQQGRPADALEALQPLVERTAPDPQVLLLAGRAYLLSGNAKRAEALFSQAAKANPGDIQSRTALAVARFAGGDRAMALSELEAISGSDSGVSADLALISAHTSQRQFDAAIKAIDQLERKQPGAPLAPHLRAWVLMLRGDLAGARESFSKALAADPQYLASIEGLATLDVREGKPERARTRYEAILKADPTDARAMAAIAQLDEFVGKPKQEVASALEKAVATQPTDPALRHRLVTYYMAKQEYRQALNAARAAVSALPEDTMLQELLAAAQLAAGEADQAMRTYSKLVSQAPKSSRLLVGLAEAQLAAKSYAAARESAARALAISPGFVAAVQTAIKVDLQTGRIDQALEKARSLQALRPTAPEGWIFEGDIEFARNRWSAAIAAFRAALQKQDSSSIAQRLHLALRSSGEPAKTDEFAADWLKKHPEDAAFMNYLASWAIVDKDLQRASTHLEQALRITPDNAALLNSLAWVQATMGKPVAVATAERANKARPNEPIYLDTLAYALAANGKLERAIDVQKQAVALAPAAHALRLNLARLYIQAGDKNAARAELAALASLGEGFSQQDQVRELQSKL